jgi:hypothetical protein
MSNVRPAFAKRMAGQNHKPSNVERSGSSKGNDELSNSAAGGWHCKRMPSRLHGLCQVAGTLRSQKYAFCGRRVDERDAKMMMWIEGGKKEVSRPRDWTIGQASRCGTSHTVLRPSSSTLVFQTPSAGYQHAVVSFACVVVCH